MKKILVVGKGFMGERIAGHLSNSGYDVSISGERIATAADVTKMYSEYKPDIVINCAGKTGRPNVDWCETHKPETYFANVHIPYLLAEESARKNVKLVHLSSGCVYQGDNNGKGWSEDDPTNFEGSYYSHTKVVSERLLSAYTNILVLRLRMPIDDKRGSRELLGKILRYKQLIDVPNSVTIIPQFLVVLDELLKRDLVGTFNLTHPVPMKHSELIRAYEAITGEDLGKEFIPVEKLDVAAPRSNCILNTQKIQALLPKEVFELDLNDLVRRYAAS